MAQVTPKEVINVMLKACPSFSEKWQQYLKETENDEERLPYMEASEFARHIVELYEAGKTDEFGAVFSSIEELLQDGAHDTEELVIIGYLEDIQGGFGWDGSKDLGDLYSFFGPKTMKAWNDLNDFWQGKTPQVGVSWEDLAKAHLEKDKQDVTEENVKAKVTELKKRVQKTTEKQVPLKKLGAVVLSVFIGIAVLSVLSAIFEATSFYLGGLSSFLALLAGIFAGMKTYAYTAPADNTTEQNENSNMPLYALFTLLILQLPFAFGYANEFEDHFFSLAAAVLFFFAELWFLFKVTQKKGVTILISILLFLSVFMMLAFINDGTDIISNKYPADVYYSTYWWVIAMLAGQALLEVLKLVILHREKIWKRQS